MKFRKKPEEIDAIQWSGNNFSEIREFVCANSSFEDAETFIHANDPQNLDCIRVMTIEGVKKAYLNDFIVKGDNGIIYICKPDIIEKQYEKV